MSQEPAETGLGAELNDLSRMVDNAVSELDKGSAERAAELLKQAKKLIRLLIDLLA